MKGRVITDMSFGLTRADMAVICAVQGLVTQKKEMGWVVTASLFTQRAGFFTVAVSRRNSVD